MALSVPTPPATFREGDELLGFRIERVTDVPEIRATAYTAVHLRTGARALHLHNDDRENLYAACFRTPPSDSTGVAHILEHSVLAGSQRYPVKDAYNELVRSTLNTFINAFTAPDFTCYPVCSQVRADFYNLATVYTDLVLRPLLARNTFLREGHHLALTDSGELTISGIVYNEMKGAFSSAERVAHSATLQGLFPDTPYGVESGGRPEQIPDLTHEQFCAFHRRFYSPANARFFFYGDIPTRDHLAFLALELSGFAPVEVDSRIADQTRWSAPRRIQVDFPIGTEDRLERRTSVNVAWLTAGAADLEQRLILEVLEQALIGTPAAPLRKALIDSGLGEDLSPISGLATWYKQLPFVVGLRGTEADRADAIEQRTLEILAGIAREGIARDVLEAAFHQVEFRGLEITRAPTPFPVVLLFRVLATWLHDYDPLLPLTLPSLMATLRQRWAADADLFRRAVGRWLVENPHRLRTTVTPSRTLAAEQEHALAERLAARRAAMTAQDLDGIRRTMAELTAEQRAQDSPQALATLPRLQVSEIPREVETIPTVEERVSGVPVLMHEVFSNSIAYLDVVCDISDVAEDLQPYLPLLGAATCGMGAAGLDYAAFATRTALVTGGLGVELDADERQDGRGAAQWLLLRARALRRNIPAMVAVVRDVIASGDLTDRARLKDILSEERNQLRANVAPVGHLYSWRLAACGLSIASWRDEQWHGIAKLRMLGDEVRRFDAEAERITGILGRLREIVFRRGRAVFNLTGDAECLSALRAELTGLAAALPEGGRVQAPGAPALRSVPHGVAIPGNVCYVARVLSVPRHNTPEAPLLWVLTTQMRTDYLYKKVRVEGGAYGGLSLYDPLRGQVAMLSYRDPHLERTLETYDGAVDALLSAELTPEGLRSMIVGAMGRLDRPMDPSAKGKEALRRWLLGLSDADRQRFREGVLTADRGRLRDAAASILRRAMVDAPQAVLAPRERIEEANRKLAVPFAIEAME